MDKGVRVIALGVMDHRGTFLVNSPLIGVSSTPTASQGRKKLLLQLGWSGGEDFDVDAVGGDGTAPDGEIKVLRDALEAGQQIEVEPFFNFVLALIGIALPSTKRSFEHGAEQTGFFL